MQGVSLHGEGMEIDEGVAAEKMEVFRSDLKELMTIKNIPLEWVFNADQTGLFYRKLPNRIYCQKEERKTVRGVKQMKD